MPQDGEQNYRKQKQYRSDKTPLSGTGKHHDLYGDIMFEYRNNQGVLYSG
jgi:hypothetical protein